MKILYPSVYYLILFKLFVYVLMYGLVYRYVYRLTKVLKVGFARMHCNAYIYQMQNMKHKQKQITERGFF